MQSQGKPPLTGAYPSPGLFCHSLCRQVVGCVGLFKALPFTSNNTAALSTSRFCERYHFYITSSDSGCPVSSLKFHSHCQAIKCLAKPTALSCHSWNNLPQRLCEKLQWIGQGELTGWHPEKKNSMILRAESNNALAIDSSLFLSPKALQLVALAIP